MRNVPHVLVIPGKRAAAPRTRITAGLGNDCLNTGFQKIPGSGVIHARNICCGGGVARVCAAHGQVVGHDKFFVCPAGPAAGVGENRAGIIKLDVVVGERLIQAGIPDSGIGGTHGDAPTVDGHGLAKPAGACRCVDGICVIPGAGAEGENVDLVCIRPAHHQGIARQVHGGAKGAAGSGVIQGLVQAPEEAFIDIDEDLSFQGSCHQQRSGSGMVKRFIARFGGPADLHNFRLVEALGRVQPVIEADCSVRAVEIDFTQAGPVGCGGGIRVARHAHDDVCAKDGHSLAEAVILCHESGWSHQAPGACPGAAHVIGRGQVGEHVHRALAGAVAGKVRGPDHDIIARNAHAGAEVIPGQHVALGSALGQGVVRCQAGQKRPAGHIKHPGRADLVIGCAAIGAVEPGRAHHQARAVISHHRTKQVAVGAALRGAGLNITCLGPDRIIIDQGLLVDKDAPIVGAAVAKIGIANDGLGAGKQHGRAKFNTACRAADRALEAHLSAVVPPENIGRVGARRAD